MGEFNVGIVTGRVSGLVVVDLDTREDAAYWLESYPKSPLMVRTGRGGLHIYYQAPKDVEVRNRIRIHSRAIDIRGEGRAWLHRLLVTQTEISTRGLALVTIGFRTSQYSTRPGERDARLSFQVIPCAEVAASNTGQITFGAFVPCRAKAVITPHFVRRANYETLDLAQKRLCVSLQAGTNQRRATVVSRLSLSTK